MFSRVMECILHPKNAQKFGKRFTKINTLSFLGARPPYGGRSDARISIISPAELNSLLAGMQMTMILIFNHN